jgi:hypothetical protein
LFDWRCRNEGSKWDARVSSKFSQGA